MSTVSFEMGTRLLIKKKAAKHGLSTVSFEMGTRQMNEQAATTSGLSTVSFEMGTRRHHRRRRLKYGRPFGASNALSTPNTSPRLDTILAFGALNFAAGTFLLDTFEAEIGIVAI